MGARYGVEFLDRDFRPLFQAGQEFAREHGFYMQKYCGCIFSEEDRYLAAKRKKAARRAAQAGADPAPIKETLSCPMGRNAQPVKKPGLPFVRRLGFWHI